MVVIKSSTPGTDCRLVWVGGMRQAKGLLVAGGGMGMRERRRKRLSGATLEGPTLTDRRGWMCPGSSRGRGGRGKGRGRASLAVVKSVVRGVVRHRGLQGTWVQAQGMVRVRVRVRTTRSVVRGWEGEQGGGRVRLVRGGAAGSKSGPRGLLRRRWWRWVVVYRSCDLAAEPHKQETPCCLLVILNPVETQSCQWGAWLCMEAPHSCTITTRNPQTLL